MRRIASSPLLHCLLLGLLLSWSPPSDWSAFRLGQGGDASGAPAEQQLLDAARNEGLDQLPAVRGRLLRLASYLGLAGPEASEAERLRAAVALGLDRTDPVVRRYLIDAMRARLAARTPVASPSDDEVARYIAARPDAFRQAARFRIRHAYVGGFDPAARELAGALGVRAFGRAEAFGDIIAAGDTFYAGHDLPALSARELAGRFGAEFATQLTSREVGTRAEPIESAYGLHVVEIVERVEARAQPQALATARARRSLLQQRRAEALAGGIAASSRRPADVPSRGGDS